MKSCCRFILNFIYNHAASRHCQNKFYPCARLAVYFKLRVQYCYFLTIALNVRNIIFMSLKNDLSAIYSELMRSLSCMTTSR